MLPDLTTKKYLHEKSNKKLDKNEKNFNPFATSYFGYLPYFLFPCQEIKIQKSSGNQKYSFHDR